MDPSVIASILRELNLNENSVANIYNYGSWVYGTNTPASDRDILIVTRSPLQEPLKFDDDFDYLHDFELHKLWNQYDVCVHSVENFEVLLQKNYLLAIECTFLPDEFKIKEEIDFQGIYLDKYYNPLRLKQVAFYENLTSVNKCNGGDLAAASQRSSSPEDSETSINDRMCKALFHGFRYLDVAEQLIRTRSIHDFRRVSHVLNEMKQTYDESDTEPTANNLMNFIQPKSDDLKRQLNALVPTNAVKGTFEAHITVDCGSDSDTTIAKLTAACENTKFKLIFIELDSTQKESKLEQLMTSSYHCGEYPAIVKQIEDEAHAHFRDFTIVRIKIEALASNEGVPATKIDKRLFWDEKSNYFEFHHKVLVDESSKDQTLQNLKTICQKSGDVRLHISRNAFKRISPTQLNYMVTMRVFDGGREEALEANDKAVAYLTSEKFAPLKTVREFVVYDTHIELDQYWR